MGSYREKYKFLSKANKLKDGTGEYDDDKEINLTERASRNSSLFLFRKVNTYYTYMNMMEQFKDDLIETDMTMILSDPLDFIYLSKSIPFRKRFMKLHKKRFTKTDKEVSALKTPVMAVQGSIMDEDPMGLFTGYFNTTDMSDIRMSGYGDVIFSKYDIDNDIDVACIMIVKQANLNVEITIMEDSLPKLENIKEAWNKLRKQDAPDIFDGVIRGIVPRELVIHILLEFKEITEDSIPDLTYKDLFFKLIKYLNSEFYLDYVVDTSTGKEEIVIQWMYEVVVKPESMNLAEPQMSEWITEGGLLTRPFALNFLIPSMFQIRNNSSNNVYNLENLASLIGNNVNKKVDNEVTVKEVGIRSPEEIVNQLADEEYAKVTGDMIAPSVDNGTQIPIHSKVIKGDFLEKAAISIASGIPTHIQEYIANLLIKDIDVSKYCTVEIRENIKGGSEYNVLPMDRMSVDWLDLKVIIKNMTDTYYKIIVYCNNEDLNRFRNTDV